MANLASAIGHEFSHAALRSSVTGQLDRTTEAPICRAGKNYYPSEARPAEFPRLPWAEPWSFELSRRPCRQSIIVHADLNTELTLDVTNLLFPEVLIFRWPPSNLSASACVCSHLIATLKIMFFSFFFPSPQRTPRTLGVIPRQRPTGGP
jgi:hypothetical protein